MTNEASRGGADELPAAGAAYSAVDEVFSAGLERQRIPGIVYGVIARGSLVHARSLGLRDVAAAAPVQIDTVFRIASMTKSVTAASILMLRDEGRLSLEDPVSDYVGELRRLRLPTADSAPVTIRNLLTMSAGFVEDDPWADRQLDMTDEDFSALLNGDLPFNSPPANRYEYSNLGYAILGRVIREVSEMSAMDWASTRIFFPLGMRQTTWDAEGIPDSQRARGYRIDGEQWVEEPPLARGAFSPMGGLWTTVSDLCRFVLLQMSAWPARDDPDTGPIRRSSLREMQQGAQTWSGRQEGWAGLAASYGFGLVAGEHPRHGRVVGHSGGLPGFGSHMQWLPDIGAGVVGFANLTYGPMRSIVSEAVEALADGGDFHPRTPAASPELLAARTAVLRLYEQWDPELASKLAAANLFLDSPESRRRLQFESLRNEHGACLSAQALVPTGALRGSWRMHCERGTLEATVWLAPTPERGVQVLRLVAVPAPPGTDPRP